MLQELQDFGLSEKEARVYLAALELGRATADELAKQAKVNRSTTYVQIESLKQKGLMSSYDEDKKTYFAPESPEYLKRLFEKQAGDLESKQKELANLLPGLTKMFETAGERPRVRFFEGKEGLITMREEVLNAKNKEILVIFSQDALSSVFSQEELDEYSDKRGEKGLKSRAIYTRAGGKFEGPHPPLTERRYMSPDRLSLGTDIAIYDNSVAIMSLKDKISGVIIENENIAKSLRSVFNILWEFADKFK